jgi:hypothetical protein
MKIRPGRVEFIYVNGLLVAFRNFANAPNYTDVCVVGMSFRTRQIFNISVTVRNNQHIIIVRGYKHSAKPVIYFYTYFFLLTGIMVMMP